MPESVSTTSTFNLPVDEMIEEAMDTLYGEHTSGYDARSARRSLNLLLIDLQNREFPLGHLEQRTLDLTADEPEYELDEDVLAIIDLNFVDEDGNEVQLTSESFLDYFNRTNKDTSGKPSLYAFDPTGDTPKLFLYPAPSDTDYTLKYWVVRKHKDVTKSYQLVDMQQKYLPALSMGLAYFMSFKRDGIAPDKIERIFNEYETRLERAFATDRDRVDFIVYPDVSLR